MTMESIVTTHKRTKFLVSEPTITQQVSFQKLH